jgi:PAS domain S-box-containing protein
MITIKTESFKQYLKWTLATCLLVFVQTVTAQNNTLNNDSLTNIINNDTLLADSDKAQLLLNLSETFNKTPEKAVIYDHLGMELAKKHNWNDKLILTSVNYARHSNDLCEYVQADSALALIENIVEEHHNEIELSDYYFLRAGNYYDWSRYQLAKEYYEKALIQYRIHKNKLGIAKSLKGLGVVVSIWSDYENAIGYLQQSRDIYIELEDEQGIESINLAMGVVMEQWGKWDVALKYYEKALNYFEKNSIIFNQVNLRLHIGDLYLKKGFPKKALDYYFAASELEKQKPHKKLRSITLSNIAEAYYASGEYRKAIKYQNKALKLKNEIGDRKRIAISLIDLGKIHLALNNYRKAVNYAQRAYKIADISNLSTQTLESLQLLSEGYSSLHLMDSAYYYLNKYIGVKDQVFNEENTKTLNNLAIKYETREKEKENQLLKLINTQNELKISKERNNKYMIILITVFVFLISVIVIIFMRAKEYSNRRSTYILQNKNKEITKQKEKLTRLNQELTESRSKYISIVENATVGMYRTTKEGKVLFANKTLLNMIHATLEELKAADLNVVKPSRKKLLALVDQQKIVTGREDIWRNKKGKEIYVNESMWVINDSEGNLLYYEGIVEDITKRKIAENQLKEKEKKLRAINNKLQANNAQLEQARQELEKAYNTKSEFLANISHEIRTPLNAIIGFTDLLLGMVKQPAQLQFIQAIRSSGRSLLSLINDILDLSKIQAGKIELHFEPVSMDNIINEISKVFTLSVKEKGLDFIVKKHPSLSKLIYLDDTRMRQILFNLIGNAVKFTENGFVKLEVDVTNETKETFDLTIMVSDSGLGIPDEKQNEIFEAFIQADRGKQTGTGLGLSITKRLVEIMGGTLSMNSLPEKGTTFTIHLPGISFFEGIVNLKKQRKEKANSFIVEQVDLNWVKNLKISKSEMDKIAKSNFSKLFKERGFRLKDGNIVSDIIVYSNDLIAFAEENKFAKLKAMCVELKDASESFDIEKIKQILQMINELFN